MTIETVRGVMPGGDWTYSCWRPPQLAGLVDARGRLYLRGRTREDINRGGTKVYPADVDAVVERFDHVMDVSTFGYDDTVFGEEVAVAVVLLVWAPSSIPLGSAATWPASCKCRRHRSTP